MTLVSSLLGAIKANSGRFLYVAHDLGLSGATLQEPIYGWLWCNGAAIANSGRYATLYGIIGTKYGVAGTLPTLIDGRVPIPKGSTNFPTVGVSSGEVSHVVTTAEYPAHVHSALDNVGDTSTPGANGLLNVDGFVNRSQEDSSKNTNSAGGGGSHPNMPPYQIGGFVLVKL